MSKQNAMKFLDKMENDPAFRKKLEDTKETDGRRKILHEAHLDFNKDECEQAFKEKYKKPMSEEQLKKIAAAGGKGKPRTIEQYKDYIKYISTALEE